MSDTIGQDIFFLFILYYLIYLSGKYFLCLLFKKRFLFLEDIFLSCVTGLLFITIFSYILSFFHIPSFFLFPLSIFFTFSLWKEELLFPVWKNDVLLPLLFIIGATILFSLPMLTSGLFHGELYLKGVNAGDGIWHLQLINELSNHFPPDIPGFAEAPLSGYHFFYNFLLSRFNYFENPTRLLFQYFPLLTAFLWTSGVYTLLFKMTKKISVGLWGIFFTCFGGSFPFFLPLLRQPFAFTSFFGVDQPIQALFNPPFAFSIVLVTFLFYCFYAFEKEKHKGWLILLTLCGGLLFMFKAYAGMIVLSSMGLFFFYYLYKRQWELLISIGGIFLLTLLTYGVFADSSSRLLFHPFWMIEKMFQEHQTWYGYTEKIHTYSQQGVLKGLLITYIVGIFIFLIGNVGTRIVGIIALLRKAITQRSYPTEFTIFLLLTSSLSFLLPFFFLQSGQVYEMIQLQWYFLFFCSLLSALGIGVLSEQIKSLVVKGILSFLLILFTLPTASITLYNYTLVPYAAYNPPLVEAGFFLAKQGVSTDILLELPSFSTPPTKQEVSNWYFGERPIATAFANKRGYIQFVNHTYTSAKREERLKEIGNISTYMLLTESDIHFEEKKKEIKNFFVKHRIKYLLTKGKNSNIEELATPIFSNSSYTLYQVVNYE